MTRAGAGGERGATEGKEQYFGGIHVSFPFDWQRVSGCLKSPAAVKGLCRLPAITGDERIAVFQPPFKRFPVWSGRMVVGIRQRSGNFVRCGGRQFRAVEVARTFGILLADKLPADGQFGFFIGKTRAVAAVIAYQRLRNRLFVPLLPTPPQPLAPKRRRNILCGCLKDNTAE